MDRNEFKAAMETKLVETYSALRAEDFWGHDGLELLSKGGQICLMTGKSPKGENAELYAQFLPGSASFQSVPRSVVFFVMCGEFGAMKKQNLSEAQASTVRDMLYKN